MARTAIVTGAASGIGYETAAGLAGQGFHVVLADRNREGGAAAAERIRAATPGAAVEFQHLDLAAQAEVRDFAARFEAGGRALDLLVNNAGVLPPLQRARSADGFELAFGIALLGHFALTLRLLPALRRAAAARVVATSSLVQAWARIDFDDLQAERSYEPQRAYDQSKLAVLMFALELDARARAAGLALRSLAAHPGVARTAIGDARLREAPRRLRDRLELWAFRAAMAWVSQDAAAGARPILFAATDAGAEGGAFYGPGGPFQWTGAPRRVEPAAAARDPATRQRLWQAAESLTGTRWPP